MKVTIDLLYRCEAERRSLIKMYQAMTTISQEQIMMLGRPSMKQIVTLNTEIKNKDDFKYSNLDNPTKVQHL